MTIWQVVKESIKWSVLSICRLWVMREPAAGLDVISLVTHCISEVDAFIFLHLT